MKPRDEDVLLRRFLRGEDITELACIDCRGRFRGRRLGTYHVETALRRAMLRADAALARKGRK